MEVKTQYMNRDKKLIGRSSYLFIGGKSASGDDAMHMDVVRQILRPCMKDLDDTGCCAEILLIRREFEKCFSAASVKDPVKELLITVDKGV